MEIFYGINPNCSETVYRFGKEYQERAEKAIKNLRKNWGEPTDGYSQMRPGKNEICYYFHQTTGSELLDWLEKNKIPYDIQSSFMDDTEYPWKEIKPTREEDDLDSAGGSGTFYKRKKYDNK